MNQEKLKTALELSGYVICYREPRPDAELVVIRDRDKGYLGLYSSLESFAHVQRENLSDETKAAIEELKKPVPVAVNRPIPKWIVPKKKG